MRKPHWNICINKKIPLVLCLRKLEFIGKAIVIKNNSQ